METARVHRRRISARPIRPTAAAAILAAAALVACAEDSATNPAGEPGALARAAPARFARRIDWLDTGVWLKADTHVHTRFSDGRWPLERVLDEASRHACDVVAITDHAHQQYETATPAYAEAIETARRERPEMILLAGLEWNVPPFGGAEHATLLLKPGPDEWSALTTFRERFDDDGTRPKREGQAAEAMAWLASRADLEPLILYNHPSRKLARSLDLLPIYRGLQAGGESLVGFSGAPGHQESEPIGAYRSAVRLIDRWDPAVATAGGAWDMLLQERRDVWAARAPSDFHRADTGRPDDYWPCEFSETWLLAPERSAAAALRALRAGTFFGVHGKIARDVRLELSARGLDRPAGAGETIVVSPGTRLDISVVARVPATDWQGEPNRLDEVEIILVGTGEVVTGSLEPARQAAGVTPPGANAMTAEPVPGIPERFVTQVHFQGGDLVIRARGRRRTGTENDLLFYTNPVRVISP